MNNKFDNLVNMANTLAYALNAVADRKTIEPERKTEHDADGNFLRESGRIGIDFRSAVVITLVSMSAQNAEKIIEDIRTQYPNDGVATDAVQNLEKAYTNYLNFMAVYSNESGLESPQEIALNTANTMRGWVSDRS